LTLLNHYSLNKITIFAPKNGNIGLDEWSFRLVKMQPHEAELPPTLPQIHLG